MDKFYGNVNVPVEILPLSEEAILDGEQQDHGGV